MLRLRALDFLAKIWLPNARSRMTLPVLVMRTRLAVPLWVLSFGILLPFPTLVDVLNALGCREPVGVE